MAESLVSCKQKTVARCWTKNSLTTLRRARPFNPCTFHTKQLVVNDIIDDRATWANRTWAALRVAPIHTDHVQVHGHWVEVTAEDELQRLLLGNREQSLEGHLVLTHWL